MKKLLITLEDVASTENLLEAWQEFIRGKRNRADVQEFSLHLMDNIIALQRDLTSHSYRHGSYRAFNICDPKPRSIHKASVRDRLLHHALYRKLYPFFDRAFIAHSYSCRTGKGTHKALDCFASFARRASKNHTRTVWVLKCDIRKFFASIDHAVLLGILKNYIPDKEVIGLLGEIIYSFSSTCSLKGEPSRPAAVGLGRALAGVGLPLGNLTSQILVNVYMNEFDQFMKRGLKTTYYLRYADDFAILSHDREQLEELLPRVDAFLTERLRLTLHPDKVSIASFASGIDFLGWVHFPNHRIVRTTTKRRMFKRIAEHPTQQTIASYAGMLKHGNAKQLTERIRKNFPLWFEVQAG